MSTLTISHIFLALFFMHVSCVDCGQTCMKCSHMVHPEDCGHVVQCGSHEQCYIREYVTDDGLRWYDAGCEDTQQCAGLLSAGFGRRQTAGETTVCETCCNNTALCNVKQKCGTDIQSSGTYCYSCQDELRPDSCDVIRLCSQYQKCLLQQSKNRYTNRLQWSSSCASEQKCQTFSSIPSQWPIVNYCCDTELCNTNSKVGHIISPPSECSDLSIQHSGVHVIYPVDKTKPVPVYCHVDADGKVWTVIQKRLDGSVDFYRNWTDYKQGFGNPQTEYWLGNDAIHNISTNGGHELKIVLTDWSNVTKYALYKHFSVEDETHLYRIHIGNYSGDAGDSMGMPDETPFSTLDRDHDRFVRSCAQVFHGAGWFTSCLCANLNGKYYHGHHGSYADGVNWCAWGRPDNRAGLHYSLKETTMMLSKL